MNKAFFTNFLGVFAMLLLINCSGSRDQNNGKDQKYEMNMTKKIFGEADGKQVFQYTLTNKNGMTVKILNYGGIVTHIIVPGKDGDMADVALGYDSLRQYLEDTPYFGALVGRYGNRIANGKFSLDGQTYTLATNNAPNHLHGGLKGFDKVVWDATDFIEPTKTGIVLTYLSKDLEEGYPGNLKVKVTYTLTADNELMIDYEAETDKTTIINLTHHSYFNLKGHGNGDILGHQMEIFADKFVPVDETLIPTGELLPVKGTPMDFNKPITIGKHIAEVVGGYDHCWVLNNYDGNVRLVARVTEPISGRVMKVMTDQPGLQFYSGNFLNGTNKGKGSTAYQKHFGFCLESEHFPDSPNQPKFPSVVLKPGEKYKTQTIYQFEVKE
jgi:aldose 1-epimerase